jgi:exportin-1
VRDVVTGMFVLSNQDLSKFKNHLRDFLVAIQEFGKSGDDNAQLYLQDQEAENSAKQLEETQRLLSIPGMIGPKCAKHKT